MSGKPLTNHQIALLTKETKFCPTTKGNYLNAKVDVSEFTRKIKLQDAFHEKINDDVSLVRKKPNYNPITKNPDLAKIIEIIERSEPTPTSMENNLTAPERRALLELKNDRKMVIKKSDKGNTLIVMSAEFYRDKLVMKDHLNTPTYCVTDPNADKKVFRELEKLMKKHEKCLTKKEYGFITNFDWKSSHIYVQPKIHKNKSIIEKVNNCKSTYLEMDPPQDLKGRPIIAGPNSPTQHLSSILEKILSPLVPYMKSYIKDNWDFLRKLPSNVDYNCTLYSCDIVSLYSNITHELGLTALEYWIEKRRNVIPTRFSTPFILESAKFVLDNNNFYFDSTMYHQLIGTAMGTIFAPPYACLAVGYLEETKLYPSLICNFGNDLAELIKETFDRFMDDGFVPWPDEADINIFIDILNDMDPTIKFTLEVASHVLIDGENVQKLNFLDITVLLHENGKVETDIFYKDTNTHDYLDYHSHHPKHIKDNIPYNLAKKIIVFCSNSKTEELRLNELRSWLIECNYPRNLINKKIHFAKLRGPAGPKSTQHIIPLVTNYASNYDCSHLARNCDNLLKGTRNQRIKEVFKNTRTVIAYKQPKNLLRQLTCANFKYDDKQLLCGLFKCNRKACLLCKFYIQECKSFFTFNNVEWKIKSYITCNSLNVIYYLVCSCCNVTSYIGKTNNLRKRMNCHISEIRTGNTSDLFDKHVISCKSVHKIMKEPYFKVYAFITLPNEESLLTYESHFHSLNYDSMN